MAIRPISVEAALERWDAFDAVIDARSPSEFALDRLPRAQNWPVLDDEERREVGTLFKQVSPLLARRVGAAMVARRIAQHLDTHLADVPRTWIPLVYCWRGGQRSGSLAWFLDQIGFRTHQLIGGYKAFRQEVRRQLDTLPSQLQFRVVAGRTGSGKSRLLQALAAEGAQVLDLEALALHRGSVLGALPDRPQPSQKQFESWIWQALRRFQPDRPVYVESESRRIGGLQIPEPLMQEMRARGSVWMVEMPMSARVQLLLEDYAHFQERTSEFCDRIGSLTELRGHARVELWQSQARAGDWAGVFEALMRDHYDPLYLKSMGSQFQGLAQAHTMALADAQEKTLRLAAQGLMADQG